MTSSSFSKLAKRTFGLAGAAILVAVVTLYLLLPIIALFFRTTPELFLASLADPEVSSALTLSLLTSIISLIIIILVGTPFAYVHCRHHTREKSLSILSSTFRSSCPRQLQVLPCWSLRTGRPCREI